MKREDKADQGNRGDREIDEKDSGRRQNGVSAYWKFDIEI
jgi:hypothetical protein